MSNELARSHVACMCLPLACGMHVWEAGGRTIAITVQHAL